MQEELNSDIESTSAKRAILVRSMSTTRPGEFTSRRMALQIELAVGLVVLAQEATITTGKAALNAVYHAVGYECMVKVDRDYKTVNRRLNMTAKPFEILGLDTITSWWEGSGGTEVRISRVGMGLAEYNFETLDDVAGFVGVSTNRTRVKFHSVDTASLEDIKVQLLAQYANETLCAFAKDLLKAVAKRT